MMIALWIFCIDKSEFPFFCVRNISNREPQFLILLLLVSFGSVGAVLFTPALPDIKSFFHVSTGAAQFTITTYLIGYALGQLPYGPLGNRFGRKKTLYMGLSLAILGSLLCAFSAPLNSFRMLVIARFLQALGASVGLKISFTMIADVYEQNQAAKKISRILLAFALMPGIAVAIGGWLTHHVNWESCFYFLTLFGLLMLWLSSLLPETIKNIDRDALKISSILHNYGLKFKNERIVISGFVMGLGTAVIYIFASKAPFIGINRIGLTPETFGFYNLIPPLGLCLGSFLATILAGRIPLLSILLFGILGALLVIGVMTILFALGMLTVETLFLPMPFLYLADAFIFANTTAFGLSHAKNKSMGSAVLNFLNLGTTVIAVLILEAVYPESALIMPLSFLVAFLLMFFLWFRLRKFDSVSP